MKSLQARFNRQITKRPFWSSYVCFAEAVKEQRFSKPIVSRWFQKLVNKDDYVKNEKRAVLTHLKHLTNMPRKTEIWGKKDPDAI